MTLADMEPRLLAYTGVPGVGKTSAIKAAEDYCIRADVNPVIMIDYPFLKKWAKQNRGKDNLVVYPNGAAIDSDDFMVRLEAYAEASLAVVTELALAIAAEVGPNKLILTEAGMGAGNPRTSYGEHFFNPLAAVLKDVVRLANAQIVIPDTNTLMERARRRYEDSNHQAPPPEVTERYLKNGIAQSSLPFAASSGFNIVFNRKIDNSHGPDQTLAQVEAMMAIVLGR